MGNQKRKGRGMIAICVILTGIIVRMTIYCAKLELKNKRLDKAFYSPNIERLIFARVGSKMYHVNDEGVVRACYIDRVETKLISNNVKTEVVVSFDGITKNHVLPERLFKSRSEAKVGGVQLIADQINELSKKL